MTENSIKDAPEMKKIALLLAMSLSSPALAQDYIDSQSGPGGTEIHVREIQLRNDLMTVVLVVENTSDEVVEFPQHKMDSIYFITGDKKYPVLEDSNGEHIGAPIGNNTWFYVHLEESELQPESDTLSWFKFEAPADSDWPIELVLPGVLPFILDKPES